MTGPGVAKYCLTTIFQPRLWVSGNRLITNNTFHLLQYLCYANYISDESWRVQRPLPKLLQVPFFFCPTGRNTFVSMLRKILSGGYKTTNFTQKRLLYPNVANQPCKFRLPKMFTTEPLPNSSKISYRGYKLKLRNCASHSRQSFFYFISISEYFYTRKFSCKGFKVKFGIEI